MGATDGSLSTHVNSNLRPIVATLPAIRTVVLAAVYSRGRACVSSFTQICQEMWKLRIQIHLRPQLKYSVIQKDGLNFVRLYFLNYTRYVNDPHKI